MPQNKPVRLREINLPKIIGRLKRDGQNRWCAEADGRVYPLSAGLQSTPHRDDEDEEVRIIVQGTPPTVVAYFSQDAMTQEDK